MILAGDIGGTKTNLGLFDVADCALAPHNQRSFPSNRFSGLESIVDEFMIGAGEPSVAAACFGVDGRSVTPNLPWVVESVSLASRLIPNSVALLNDLEATAQRGCGQHRAAGDSRGGSLRRRRNRVEEHREAQGWNFHESLHRQGKALLIA